MVLLASVWIHVGKNNLFSFFHKTSPIALMTETITNSMNRAASRSVKVGEGEGGRLVAHNVTVSVKCCLEPDYLSIVL